MKKQILFLAIFSLAIFFAGTTKVLGQTYTNYLEPTVPGTIDCTPAIPLGCVADADALHPIAGQVYTYTITVDPDTYKSIHWFVTDVANVVAMQNALTSDIDPIGGDYVLTATAAAYNKPDGSIPENLSETIDISWKSFDPTAHQVLLVAYVTGAAGCSDNIEVYRIEPVFNFTLDVAGLLDNGDLGAEECISPIETASYDGTDLTVDYGENWVFFSVNAANFVNSWEPTFGATVTGGSTIGTVEWAYPADAEANTAGNWHASGVPVDAVDASGAVGSGGECIIVRVQVEHDDIENDASVAAPVVTLTINGVMYDPAAAVGSEYDNSDLADLDEPAASGACVNDVDDTADYTLTPRPSIVDAIPDTPNATDFEPKNP